MLANLLCFGVAYTQECRIDDEYFRCYGDSSLVNFFADRRIDPEIAEVSRWISVRG